jgi:Helix-turn-helix family
MSSIHPARQLWALFEPIHAITYFAPHCRAAFEQAGLRGFWRGYFAGRAAPLGPVGAAPVCAAFFSFAPSMVQRALPDVWSRATPGVTLAARLAGARAALAEVFDDDSAAVTAAADLLRIAAERIDTGGRILGAANAALPWPDEPIEVLWHASTLLREHRGDGHVAALVTCGLDPAEVLAWRTGLGGYDRAGLQAARGWTDDEWSAAVQRLTARGWLNHDGTPTELARSAYADAEAVTDRLAIVAWEGIDLDRVRAVVQPFTMRAASLLPYPNPIGLPDPRALLSPGSVPNSKPGIG